MAEQAQNQSESAMYFFTGLLVGGLAGAAVSLLMAPRSGQETRDQLLQKGIELRDEATETADHALGHIRYEGKKASSEIRGKMVELKQHGQKLIDEQREHFSTVLAVASDEVKVS